MITFYIPKDEQEQVNNFGVDLTIKNEIIFYDFSYLRGFLFFFFFK